MLKSLKTNIATPKRADFLDDLIASSAADHGHLCPGQVVGVRMTLLGMRLIGLPLPLREDDIKKLIVYVEMDRCAADAVAHVSGARLGRRSLKYVDCGIMAATFINLKSDKAVRVVSTERSRDVTSEWTLPGLTGTEASIEAYKRMPEGLMFRVQEVEVDLSEFDLPGPSRRKAVCQACGQVVRDSREHLVDGRTLCRHCAGEGYFRFLKHVPADDNGEY